jgi:hypothetical protein
MMMRLLLFALSIPILSAAQGTLITSNGREFILNSFNSYKINDDGSMIDVRICPTCLTSIPVDSVAELVSFSEEKIYHLKRLLMPSLKFAFLELVSSGKVTVYKRKSKTIERGSGGQVPKRPRAWANYTEVEEYFLEKNGFLIQVLPAYGSQFQQGLLLKEFVSDDSEASREIDNVKFSLSSASLLRVVEEYNARCFESSMAMDTEGLVSLLLVGDPANLPLAVTVNDEPSREDRQLFTFRIPVSENSKVCVATDTYSKCQVMRGTRHFPLFYEVRVDKSDQEIRFKRTHSKRFSNMAGRVASARFH